VHVRDLKILLLVINKLFFDWMKCSYHNIEESQKTQMEIGYFFEGKYYLNSKEEAKALS